MNVCIDEVREIAWSGLFGDGMNDDFGRTRLRCHFFDQARRVWLGKIDRDGATGSGAVASRKTGDVMLVCHQMFSQSGAEKATPTGNPDVQANRSPGSK